MGPEFPDAAKGLATQVREELSLSPLYILIRAVAEKAEQTWCDAAVREHQRGRYKHRHQHEYSAEELFAEQLLELIGTPAGVCDELLERVARIMVEHERSVAA